MLSAKKIFSGLALSFLGLGVFWVYLHRERFWALNQILVSYHAKELCTCLMVLEMPEKYCEEFAQQIMNFNNYSYHRERQEVTTALFGFKASASYRGENLGCTLK